MSAATENTYAVLYNFLEVRPDGSRILVGVMAFEPTNPIDKLEAARFRAQLAHSWGCRTVDIICVRA